MLRLKIAGLIAGTVLWGMLGIDPASAAAPYLHVKQKMNYQGMLTNSSGTPVTGTRSMVFRIYDQSTGGSSQWTETQSSVAVSAGIFNVVLGSVNPMQIPFRKEYWLEIQVETETMSPRHLLSNAAYAMASRKVVYQQVITVALDGGDTNTVYGALQMIPAENPSSGVNDQWLVEIQAGTFTETNSLLIPSGAVIRGQGANATQIVLPSSGTISLSSNSGLECAGITLQGVSGSISLFGVSSSYLRDCSIIANGTGTGAVNLGNSSYCECVRNRITAQSSGNYMVYMQNANYARVENNYIDITQITNGTAINAPNITYSTILYNTVRFEGATDSTYGAKISQSDSTNRVSYNVFFGEATTPAAQDIYNTGTFAYPVRPAHTGPYGICNQGSGGTELPAF